MAIETITIIKQILCKRCNSKHTIRKGKKHGHQYYYCKDCGYYFAGGDAFPKDHLPKEVVGNAIGMFYRGIPTNQIDEQLKSIYKDKINQSTIYRWVIKYSQSAIKYTSHFNPEVGQAWFVDETAFKIEGDQYWYWDVIDYKTRFLIATHISKSRDLENAKAIFKKCKKATDVHPRIIVSDKLPAYPASLASVYPNTKHVTSKGFKAQINTNLIERFHGTLKQRYKILRGLKTFRTSEIILDGFVVFYNFIKPYLALDCKRKGVKAYKTPAKKAKIEFEFENWKELIESVIEYNRNLKSK